MNSIMRAFRLTLRISIACALPIAGAPLLFAQSAAVGASVSAGVSAGAPVGSVNASINASLNAEASMPGAGSGGGGAAMAQPLPRAAGRLNPVHHHRSAANLLAARRSAASGLRTSLLSHGHRSHFAGAQAKSHSTTPHTTAGGSSGGGVSAGSFPDSTREIVLPSPPDPGTESPLDWSPGLNFGFPDFQDRTFLNPTLFVGEKRHNARRRPRTSRATSTGASPLAPFPLDSLSTSLPGASSFGGLTQPALGPSLSDLTTIQ